MKFSGAFIFLALTTPTVFGRRLRECGSHLTSEAKKVAEDDFRTRKVSGHAFNTSTPLNIYFHVVKKGEKLTDGNIPDSQIKDQIKVLNEDFVPLGISFSLVNISRTTNSSWFNSAALNNKQNNDMKSALHIGGPLDLNLYSVGFTNSGLLGYATFPFWYADSPWNDGVVFHFASVPGGAEKPYDLGKTVTHEVGHWVGLYHTFQDGCDGKGDEVDDTPPESGPVFGCPKTSDSCSQPGLDPFHNYMDYSDDNCLTEFTPGQVVRVTDQMATYRYSAA